LIIKIYFEKLEIEKSPVSSSDSIPGSDVDDDGVEHKKSDDDKEKVPNKKTKEVTVVLI
jgi:hypothetical protein